jgi:hypothetical protein
MKSRAPWYARWIGVPLILFAVLDVIGFFSLPSSEWGSTRDIALNVSGSILSLPT